MTGDDALAGVRQRYAALLRRLGPEASRSPFHHQVQVRPTNNGEAHVEVVDGRLDYVVTERGAELQRRTAADADELLFWLLDDVVGSIVLRRRATWWARWRGHDPRRAKFAQHLQLLARLDPAWAARKRRHYDDVLQKYPFRPRRR